MASPIKQKNRLFFQSFRYSESLRAKDSKQLELNLNVPFSSEFRVLTLLINSHAGQRMSRRRAFRQDCFEQNPQLQFEFYLKSNIVRMVPRRKQVFLDMRLTDFVRSSSDLYSPAVRISNDGIAYIGELIRLAPESIAKLLKYDAKLMRQLEESLDRIGLEFGSTLAGWERPHLDY